MELPYIENAETILKGWGREVVWASYSKYCSKFLVFVTGGQSSMHFHREKTESWLVLAGRFQLEILNMKTAERTTTDLILGDTVYLPPMRPHRLTCLEAGTILEVSTQDSELDNYRVEPGDSQKGVSC